MVKMRLGGISIGSLKRIIEINREDLRSCKLHGKKLIFYLFHFACPGTIEATSATLVRVNAPLDYALLRMHNNVSGTYGFFQLRESGAVLNERIYIPQHPQAWGKRIALFSSDQNDAGGGLQESFP